jgi:outer membrane lipoprotein-sorting protein
MKRTTIISAIIIALIFTTRISAQEEQDSTLNITEDSTKTEVDSLRAYISGIIKEVNRRSGLVDNMISSGEITVKTAQIDNSGDIEIHIKKKDDVWFKIEGPFGKDVAISHFDRKRFLFYDALNDEAITGTTNIINIGTLTRIRCTFDDLLNAFSGTVRIPKSKTDIMSIEEQGNQYEVTMKRGTITRKYWVDKDNYSVYKYAYYDKKMQTLIQFEFSNFVTHGEGYYAKTVEVRRPKKNEYFKLKMESVSLDQSYMDFKVDVPSDAKRKNWH